jgi:NitT/TauT family transport system ATP-binding protein
MSSIGLELKNISKTFENGTMAIENLSLHIEGGEFVAILGPSGCGKSTLLRLISHLEKPSSGSLHWSTNETPRLGYVFQDPHLLPWKNVYENVALTFRLHAHAADIKEQVKSALSMVGLLDFAHFYPAQLSGGMKMRVSLCRALVNDPQVLLLDEPFAALDEFTRHKLDEELRHLWISKKMTVLFVTHSIAEATFLANRHIVLSKRPAKIIADLKSELSNHRDSKTKLSTEFLNEVRKLSEAFHES